MTVSEKNRGSQPKEPLGTFEPATPTKSSILMGSRRCALTQKTKQKKEKKKKKKNGPERPAYRAILVYVAMIPGFSTEFWAHTQKEKTAKNSQAASVSSTLSAGCDAESLEETWHDNCRPTTFRLASKSEQAPCRIKQGWRATKGSGTFHLCTSDTCCKSHASASFSCQGTGCLQARPS